MPEKYSNVIYLFFIIAAISGGLGGCSVASHRLLTGRQMQMSYLLAYGVLGMVFGLFFAAYGFVVTDQHPSEIIGPALGAGILGSTALGSVNWTAKLILKHLGIEIQVTMRKSDEDRRGDTPE